MHEPWGLSGPEFLALYVAGYVASVVLVFVVQAVLTRIGSYAAGAVAPLDVYQTAYLAGGPGRVVETAIAGLVLRDQILVARRGRLTVVSNAAPSGPVETAVCDTLTRAPSLPSARVVAWLRRHPSVTAIAEEVRLRGLLLTHSRVLVWRLVLLVPVAVWCVGLARAINGANLGRPIGNLTGLLVVSGIATLILVLARWLSANRQPSAAGRSALRQLRQQRKTASTRDIGMQVAGVAVLGYTALADPALRVSLITYTGSGGGGGWSGGGGSSCGGGGGGCGGGGGGCGG